MRQFGTWKTQLAGLLPLLSLDAMRSLSDRVITPLENSLNPNLWPEGDGNHVNPSNGSEVFTNQRDVVDTLSDILIDPTQLWVVAQVDENQIDVPSELQVLKSVIEDKPADAAFGKFAASSPAIATDAQGNAIAQPGAK
jgi:hypothetical protein